MKSSYFSWWPPGPVSCKWHSQFFISGIAQHFLYPFCWWLLRLIPPHHSGETLVLLSPLLPLMFFKEDWHYSRPIQRCGGAIYWSYKGTGFTLLRRVEPSKKLTHHDRDNLGKLLVGAGLRGWISHMAKEGSVPQVELCNLHGTS